MAKKKSRRPNLSQETLERARAEMRGERYNDLPLETSADVASSSAAKNSAVTGGTTASAMLAATAKKARRANPSLATRHIPTTDELIREYGYVLRDLRYLAIIAGILMLAIIAAAFILPRPTG